MAAVTEEPLMMTDSSTTTEMDVNMNEEEYVKGTGVRKKDMTEDRKILQKYLYHQDYHEALRSLLWEPYDCRDSNHNIAHVEESDDENQENWCLLTGSVPPRRLSSSASSGSSSPEPVASDKRVSWPMLRTLASPSPRPCSLQLSEPAYDPHCGPSHDPGLSGSVSRQGPLVSAWFAQPWQPQCELRRGAEAIPTPLTSMSFSGLDPPDPSESTSLVHPQPVTVVRSLIGNPVTRDTPFGNQVTSTQSAGSIGNQLGSFGDAVTSNQPCGSFCNPVSNQPSFSTSATSTQPSGSLGTPATSAHVKPPQRNETKSFIGSSVSNVSLHGPSRTVQSSVSNVSVNPARLSEASANLIRSPKTSSVSVIRSLADPIPSSSNVIQDPPPCPPKPTSSATVADTSKPSPNVSVVNCYRAVPVAVVSSVPTIKCLNTQENVSNVNVVPYARRSAAPKRPASALTPKPEKSLTNHSRSVSNPVLGQPRLASNFGSQQNLPLRLETHFGEESHRPPPPLPVEVNVIHSPPPLPEPPKPRTFTSTEAQTDDIGVSLNVPLRNITNREQRRRERRERRHQRRLQQTAIEGWQTNLEGGEVRGLPDILHSHLPPPYLPGTNVPVPPSVLVPTPMPAGPPLPHMVDPGLGSPLQPPVVGFPFSFSASSRRSRLSPRNSGYVHEEEMPKACCGMVVTQAVSIRWFIVMIAFVGFCCVTVGTVLGAMKASGREHLTVSLLMIGVGIVLVTVSVVAWRLTSQDAPSCRSMLGFGSGEDSATEPNRRFVPRMPPSYGRPHHPYAAMMYPDFQYRPPPPSYQASMQEYRLRLLLLERPGVPAVAAQNSASPPPLYRPVNHGSLALRAPGMCRSVPQSEYSHPPSYRSRTSSTRPSVDPGGGGSIQHSRDPSLVSHVSDGNGNAVQLHPSEELQLDSIKLCVDGELPIPPLRMLLSAKPGKNQNQNSTGKIAGQHGGKSDNVNLVTIVTVHDASVTAPSHDPALDNDVLAHL